MNPLGTTPRVFASVILAAFGISATQAGEHPRLLVPAADVARMRHACGVGAPGSTRDFGAFGARSAEYHAMRVHLARTFRNDDSESRLPGELAAAALMHLVDPADPGESTRLAAINAALLRPPILDDDAIELLLALDWCWPALDPAARREFLLAVREIGRPLSSSDSPLEHRVFREKLLVLAAAVAVDEQDEPGGAWLEFRGRILNGARSYFAEAFPRFLEWRGLSPTGSAAATWEESDAALAIELAWQAGAADAWESQRDNVARWCEHRILSSVRQAGMSARLLHDDWGPRAASAWTDAKPPIPSTAHLIAARTRDPSAAAVAHELDASWRSGRASIAPGEWVSSLLFDLRTIPQADLAALPAARNLRGSVVFRGRALRGTPDEETTIWIDAAQPFLRKRQHFDAGHFLIHRGGMLAVAGGDDIAGEATAEKGGSQRLGTRAEPADFEQYFAGTIAHNCVIFNDPARAAHWYGNRYAPIGGQRPRENTLRDFSQPLDEAARSMGKTLAYGGRDRTAYLALDLTDAYDNRSVTRYTREFVFVAGRALIVIDRARPAHNRVEPTVLVQIPARPTVDGQDLRPEWRNRGAKTSDNEAGVWDCDAARWIRTVQGNGALWIGCAWPQARHVRIVGGPGRLLSHTTPAGRVVRYLGGDANGFERLVVPWGRSGAANAWYRLGPKSAADHASMPHWGRIEIESAGELGHYLFVTVLVSSAAPSKSPPAIEMKRAADGYELSLSLPDEKVMVCLPGGEKIGGRVEFVDPPREAWLFPDGITPDPPLTVK